MFTLGFTLNSFETNILKLLVAFSAVFTYKKISEDRRPGNSGYGLKFSLIVGLCTFASVYITDILRQRRVCKQKYHSTQMEKK